MLPALEHAGALGREEEALLVEESDELGAKQLLHRIHAVLRQYQETFVAQEQSVGHEQLQVGVKVEVFVPQSRDVDGLARQSGIEEVSTSSSSGQAAEP
ncbi:MAG: hypothetical protein ACI9TH_003692 [Kiritimatiellia bacterium]|jgi:hypothetical protein